jgi:3',5'-cyclic AMP phosphodiesterase CpdA
MNRDEGNPCDKIEKIIQIARETKIKPAFSIITGDVSQNGSDKGYKIAQEYVSQIEALGGPVLPAVGNVDDRQRFRKNLLKETTTEKKTPCYYSKTMDGVHIIVLDSQSPGKVTGALEGEQLDWLEKQLSNHTEPTIIALHHPPFKLPLPNGGSHTVFDLEDMERFNNIVKSSNVDAVLCGHLHQSLIAHRGGVHYVIGCAALSEVFFGMDEYMTYDSSGFTVYTLSGGTLTVRPVIYTEGRRLVNTTGL